MNKNYLPGTIDRSCLTFDFCGFRLPLFPHYHNCGHPPGVMSERSVELSLANVFLDTVSRDTTVEIGAVTPYYWPFRVKNICDPVDTHIRVNIKASFLDVNFDQCSVLSLSTFEHIGQKDYGLPDDSSMNKQAFEKLFVESPRFLITVPGGYNAEMDKYLFALNCQEQGVEINHLVRVQENNWVQSFDAKIEDLKFSYGAYNLIVISRGTFLNKS